MGEKGHRSGPADDHFDLGSEGWYRQKQVLWSRLFPVAYIDVQCDFLLRSSTAATKEFVSFMSRSLDAFEDTPGHFVSSARFSYAHWCGYPAPTDDIRVQLQVAPSLFGASSRSILAKQIPMPITPQTRQNRFDGPLTRVLSITTDQSTFPVTGRRRAGIA